MSFLALSRLTDDAAEPAAWGPVAILVLIAVAFAIIVLGLSAAIGRSRNGPVKGAPYESGIEPAGDARRRFNIRYYIIAIIFLLFDVEVVLLFPWAVIFRQSAGAGGDPVLLGEALVFLFILAIGYIYAWRRGVLQFD